MIDKEKAICKQYSKRDKNGKVHCVDCPLVIDKNACVCNKIQVPSCLTNPERQAELLERYQEE